MQHKFTYESSNSSMNILHAHKHKFPDFVMTILNKNFIYNGCQVIFDPHFCVCLIVHLYLHFFLKLIVAELGWKNIEFFLYRAFFLFWLLILCFPAQHTKNNLNHEAKIIYHYQFSLHFLSFINFQFIFKKYVFIAFDRKKIILRLSCYSALQFH